MAYARYATSDTIYALNDDTFEVEILQDGVQSQNHKFEVGPAGVQLIYESPQDDILIPGIVHSRCEVETIWTPDVADELEDMIESMVDSEDGVWFMQVYKNGNRFWFGPILIDEVQLQETSAARACRIVASDGISLLKTVDYNDSGAEYTTEQIIFDEVLTNIQEKWVSYDYADFYFSGAERRLAVCDDMYSQDIYTIATTPSGTDSSLTRKMKLSPHMFSYTNDDDEIEFVNCYELLESICKTLLLRLYYYEQGWFFIPCYNQDTPVRGNVLNWSGVYTSGVTLIDSFNYQIDTLNNEKQKGNEWNHTFTPAINEVTITRDTNNGSIVLGQTQITGGTSISAGGIQFTTGDSGYILYGNCLVERSALNPTVSVTDADRVGRYVLALQIRFGSDPTAYQYYMNTLEAQAQGVLSLGFNISSDGNGNVYVPLSVSTGQYNTDDQDFHWHDIQACAFDSNEDNASHIFFNLEMPPVPVDLQGVQVTAGIFCFDREGEFSQTLQDTIDTQTWALYFTYGQDTVEPAPSYDVVANSTFGRGSIDLGKTYIGELHQNVGGIMVETSAGVFQTSQNWSTQRYDYDGECNQVGVREVLAAHYKPRVVERGNIVMRGNGVAPPPFHMFIDDDTTDIYQCINYRLASTPAEVEVTLHKVGTDGQAQTTTTSKDYGTTPIPNPNTGPGIGVGQSFTQSTSNSDFNDDAADAFGQDYSSVFGTDETIEGYVTYVGPSKGQFYDFQTNTPPTGFDIVRKIYTSNDGFANASNTWNEIHANYRPAKNNTLRQAIKKIDEHTAQTTNPDRSFIITWQKTSTPSLLDDYSNAQVAYSLRKLNSSYTGNAIKVRNGAGTTLDIGFDSNGDLDTAAINTHIGSGTGTIETWYDQSGNSRNATQNIVGLQPEIASAGTVHTVNGKPAVLFANNYLDTASVAINPNGQVNAAAVVQFDNVTSRQIVGSQWSSTASLQNFFIQMQEVVVGLRMGYRYTNGNLAYVDQTATATLDTQYLMSGEFFPNTCRAYYNGTLDTQTNTVSIFGVNPRNNSIPLRLGALSSNGTQLLRGFIQEYIHWSNTTAHDGEDISDDINSYYSVF